MAKRHYEDIYGGTACIAEKRDGWLLTMSIAGRRHWKKLYATYKGARIAMARMGDCWREVTGK